MNSSTPPSAGDRDESISLASAPGRRLDSAGAVTGASAATELESEVDRLRTDHRMLLEAEATAGLGSWTWDPVADVVVWSDAHYDIFGLDPAHFTPTLARAKEALHEDDRDWVVEEVERALNNGESWNLTFRIRRRPDQTRWIESFGTPSFVDGLVVRWVGTVRDVTARETNVADLRAMVTDITARREAEEELSVSQTGLAEAQSLAHLGSWCLDRATGRTTCSDEMFRVFGLEPNHDELRLDRFLLLVHPDDRPRSEMFLKGVTEGVVALSDDVRITTPEGDERWLSMRATPVFSESDRVIEVHGTVQDISDRRASEERFSHLTRHDQLTNLPNRALFNVRLNQALSRPSGSVTVMLIDLDGFKAINDGFGHAAGDALLVIIANRLLHALRPTDTLARFGGDEFTVILEDASEEEARRTAERLLFTLSTPVALEGRKVLVQASIGLAAGSGRHQNADALLRDADAAMYAAKRTGGNHYELFSASMHAEVVKRLALECDLRSVELGTEMVLHYQPIVDLGDGSLVGVEALLRWNHPTRGTIAPDEFIAIAEASGAIVPIGQWVIEEACRQSALWRVAYPDAPALSMNVNVSARQLADSDIVDNVARSLKATGGDPGLVTLEITETLVLADEEELSKRVRELKGLGVRISVDDFGTGYSSLGQLDRFPVDELKIDKSFVASLGGDAPDSGVALAVIRLARSLRIDVVAEGIELEDQLVELRRAACTKGQGYFFWKPMGARAVEALLAEGARVTLPAPAARVVLVVDDDEDLVRSIGRVLERAGIDSVEARTGREALKLADTVRFDAVILDVSLPDIDGFEVSRQLDEQFQGELPVLHLSGAAMELDDRIRGLDLGAEAYLTKPVAPAELLAVLGSMFRRSQSSHGR